MAANPRINGCNWIFRCPRQWEKLATTIDRAVRHCAACDQFVYLCETEQEVEFHANQRHCVALVPQQIDLPRLTGMVAPPSNLSSNDSEIDHG